MQMKRFSLLFTLLFLATAAFAQLGTLKGKITDTASGEAVIGAAVFITGTNKVTTTDLDGNYSLQLAPGIYSIKVSLVSYKPANQENIKITAGQTTVMNLKVEEAAQSLETVTVVATRQTNSDISLINDIRQSEVVVSGMSGQQIAKSMDRDAAQVVKRIPGVTIQGNRFIMVRGLSERYNTVLLNDALTPSSEVDARAFSFDILPTSVIDRILIFKSASPELPGDFAGGAIKIYTKNFNEENLTSVSLSSSYRSNTTFRNFYNSAGSRTDFLGFDDGTRSLPGNFPGKLSSSNLAQNAEFGRQLQNNWLPSQSTASPDLRVSLGISRKMNLGKVRVSNISSISYSNTRQFAAIDRNTYQEYNPATQRAEAETSTRDLQSSENIRLGVLHNWAASFNDRNKIEFRNLFNQLGSDQATIRNVRDFANGVERQDYSMRYESRTIYSGQFKGTHQNRNENTTYNWATGYSYVGRQEPDYRRVRTTRDLGSNDDFKVVIPPGPSTLDAGRFFSDLSENTFMASGDIEHKLGKKDSTSENRIKLKAGFYGEQKNRDFNARWMSYVRAPGHDYTLDELPLDQIFSPQNISTTGGFNLAEGTNPSDKYEASNTLAAGYISASVPMSTKVNVSGGVRVEHNIRKLSSGTFGGSAIEVNNPITSILPSVNASYNFSKKSLVRAAYGVTVNRPEFREQAPFTYYDFNYNIEIKGNTELQTPVIQNVEMRYEYYPNPTELVSFGVFYKHFKNPIEMYITPSSGNNTYTFVNAAEANSVGVETEIRKSLLDLSERKFIQNTQLILNASYIRSRVNFGNDAVGQASNRPLQGQSPYIINTGLYYQDADNGWQMSLLYNVIGRRIFMVGNYAEPTVYEMPRNVIDLSVSKTIGNLEVKLGIQDILNQATRLVQDSDENGKINAKDGSFANFQTGVYSTLGVSYKF